MQILAFPLSRFCVFAVNMDDLYDEYDDISFDEFEHSDTTKALFQKFQNKVDFDVKTREKTRDKSDRATTDHALDRRSCAILYKMMSQGTFTEVNGCISTGGSSCVFTFCLAKLCCFSIL